MYISIAFRAQYKYSLFQKTFNIPYLGNEPFEDKSYIANCRCRYFILILNDLKRINPILIKYIQNKSLNMTMKKFNHLETPLTKVNIVNHISASAAYILSSYHTLEKCICIS